MANRRGNSFRTWLPLPDGRRRQLTLGTQRADVARDMERMLKALKQRRDWSLLEAIDAGRLSAEAVHAAWKLGDVPLDRVRASLTDVDLCTLVPTWLQWMTKRGTSAEQAGRYQYHIQALLTPQPFLRSALTKSHVSRSLDALKVSSTTRYHYWVCWNQFAKYLVETDVIRFNPVTAIERPKVKPPRTLFLEFEDVRRLVDAQREPFRTIAALREGTGAEVSAALRVRRRDVNLKEGIVHLHGTKSEWRRRPVVIENWARPYLAHWLQQQAGLPDAQLFPGITRYKVRLVHRDAVKALSLPAGYRVHDSRHSFAVRWMRAGIDPNIIANQLGHKDATLVIRVYGRERPSRMQLAAFEMEKLQAVKTL